MASSGPPPLWQALNVSNKLNAALGSIQLQDNAQQKEIFSIFFMTSKLWWKFYLSFLHHFFKEIKSCCNAYDLASLAHRFKFQLYFKTSRFKSQILILFCDGWKRKCNLQATSSSKKVAVGKHRLATSLGRKALNKVSKFPWSTFFNQVALRRRGHGSPNKVLWGTSPFPNSHFFMDKFFKRCHYKEFMY